MSGKEPKWLYRLESTDPNNGLWYDSSGEWCWGIGEIEGCETKHLPMDYDERYRKDGHMWHSSCSRPEDLAHWYSFDDACKLIESGFRFTKYLATEYVEYPMETCFIKDTCIWFDVIGTGELYWLMKEARE